jgi:hypothetical protein
MTEQQAYKSIGELCEQLRRIEFNPSSYLGGMKAFSSGHNIFYTRHAEKKITNIKAKIIHLEQFIEEV